MLRGCGTSTAPSCRFAFGMRGRAFGVLLILSACAHTSTKVLPPAVHGPLTYRVLAQRTNPHPCVSAPQFGVAQDENHWIDVFDMETACDSKLTTIPLPGVDFDTEVAVAAWWSDQTCATRSAKVLSVVRG